MSNEDKETFKTLYNYLNGSEEVYQKAVETFKELERKFDVNNYSIRYDEENLPYTKLRYLIH